MIIILSIIIFCLIALCFFFLWENKQLYEDLDRKTLLINSLFDLLDKSNKNSNEVLNNYNL